MDLEKHVMLPTIRKIFENYVNDRVSSHRPHLGGSQIGHGCDRALWYQFRWAWSPQFDGRQLRLFETGDREEGRIVANLRRAGVTVWDRDPETGKQIRFDECGGHFGLSLDGVGEGFEESSQPHTLEFKTMNAKNFASIKKDGLQKSKPVYWAQCQIGMHLAGLERCYFIAVCKDTDDIYAERVKHDAAEGMQLVAKARRIVFAGEPPQRMNEDPAWWECKFCTYRGLCHHGALPEVNCRTCAHSTPEKDGTWSCVKNGAIDDAAQRAGCRKHLFIPSMTPWEVVDASSDHVEYMDADSGQVIVNNGNSAEIWKEFLHEA